MQFNTEDFKVSELYQFIITIAVILLYAIMIITGRPTGAFETLIAVVVTYWFANALNGRKMQHQDIKIQALAKKVDTQDTKAVKPEAVKNE